MRSFLICGLLAAFSSISASAGDYRPSLSSEANDFVGANPGSLASATVFTSSGSVLIQSTVTTPGAYILQVSSNNGSTLLRVQEDGKVGIGNSAPVYLLDSSGDIRTNGQIIVAGTGTIVGNSFSVGSSTFIVTGGVVYVGGTGSPGGASILRLNSSNNFMVVQATATGSSSYGQLGYGSATPGTPGTGVLTWTDAAKVGIGTTNPYSSLHISNIAGTSTITFSASGSFQNAYMGKDGTGLSFGYSSSNGSLVPVETVRMMDSTGNVGISTSNPGSRLTVIGTITQTGTLSCATGIQVTATGTLAGCVASDLRLKENVLQLKYNPDLIDELKPITFNFKKNNSRYEGDMAGFGAQDVQKIFPRAVVPAGKDLLGIDANAMIAPVVLELQELRKRVAYLEKRRRLWGKHKTQ